MLAIFASFPKIRERGSFRCTFTQVLDFAVFTALHVMQTQSSDENSVSPSVCLSVCQTREL